MTAEKAYYSFATLMTNALSGSGITVYTEKPEDDPVLPYIVIQCGNETIDHGWLFQLLVQAWVVVKREDTRQLNVTLNNAVAKVVAMGRDIGSFNKLDLPDNPGRVIGVVNCRLLGPIVEQPAYDPNQAKKVITWELSGNCK